MRPKMPDELKLTEPVYTSLRPEEKRDLDERSAATGRTRSSLLREAWLEKLEREDREKE